MIRLPQLLAFLVLLAAPGAAPAGPGNDVIAADMERAFIARYPGVPLQRYARFFAHLPGERVRGIWVFSNEGYAPMAGTAGVRQWVTVDALPQIYDGACAVLNIEYDRRSGAIQEFDCNGLGGE